MTQTKTRPRPHVDRVALILLIGVVGSAAWSIAAAEWMPDLDLLGLSVIVGLLFGALIATRPWRAIWAHLVMVLYGVGWVTYVSIQQMPDKVYGMTGLDSLRHQIVRLGEHIWLWGQSIAAGGVGTDNTIFLMFLAAVFWLITYIAAWNTFRERRIWLAIAPSGILILINTYYYGGTRAIILLLGLYLFWVLLYAARLYTLSQEERWQFSRIGFDPDIRRDLLQVGSSIAVVAVIFSAVAPNVVGAPQVAGLWREISRPLRSVEDSFSRLFSGLQPNGLAFANPFGRTLALLGQRTLGNELVMEVVATERNYWQAATYDQYTGGAFQSSNTTRLAVDPNERPVLGALTQRQIVTQTFTVFFPNSTLVFAAPQPLAVVGLETWLETYPDSANGDFAMWSTMTPLASGDRYQVISQVSNAAIEQLRVASTIYPDYIEDRYLQLPATLPARVRQLARQIVDEAGAKTVFDQAAALESWLRANIKYNEKIPAPAPGQDGVDYVLFATKQGYCDYYASAFAVMARSLGIPARIATGYTPGNFDQERGLYQVYQFNAHTWPEVYFPQYGWVQFEPTASQPNIDRPIASIVSAADNAGDVVPTPPAPLDPDAPADVDEDLESLRNRESLDDTASAQATNSAVLNVLGWVLIIGAAAAVMLGATLGGMWLYENRGSRQLTRGGEWAFARLARMAKWLRVKLSPAQTPYEQARAISAILVGSEGTVDRVTSLYVQERYGRTPADPQETRSIWRALRRPLWLAGLKRRARALIPTRRLRR